MLIEFSVKDQHSTEHAFPFSAHVIRGFDYDLLLGNTFNVKHDICVNNSDQCVEFCTLKGKISVPFYVNQKRRKFVKVLKTQIIQPHQSINVDVSKNQKQRNLDVKRFVKTNATVLDKHQLYVLKRKVLLCNRLAKITIKNDSDELKRIICGEITSDFEPIYNVNKTCMQFSRTSQIMEKKIILNFNEGTQIEG